MIADNILKLYKKLREPYTSKYYVGVTQGKAKACLKHAKRTIKVNRVWDVLEECGLVKLDIQPDYDITCEDLAGDTYDIIGIGDSISGGKRTIIAQEKKFIERCQQGIVSIHGYVRCITCGDWNRVHTGDINGILVDEWGESEYITDIKEETIEYLKSGCHQYGY